MTIAVIIACKDSFYLVSDTLSRGNEVFSLNTQKSFFSQKHRVGLCIAGEAVLMFNGIGHESEVLYVDYVINEFFQYLDSLDVFTVENMQSTLQSFFQQKYDRYWDWFLNRVSYFYGGFIVSQDKTITTAIYQHHVKRDEKSGELIEILNTSYRWSDQDSSPCYFANTNAIQKYIDWTLKLPGTPSGMTPKKFLTESGWRQYFLTFTIPHACLAINHSHPYSIGNYLHHTELYKSSDVTHRVIKYGKCDSSTGVSYELDPPDAPIYLLYRSYEESNQAFIEKRLVKYSVSSGYPLPLEIPAEKPLEVSTAQTKPRPHSDGTTSHGLMLLQSSRLFCSANPRVSASTSASDMATVSRKRSASF